MTDAKIVVACRVLPELKAQLENEAAERGETLSSYLDLLITHREHIFEDSTDTVDQELFDKNKNYIARLEAENTQLQNEVHRLVNQITLTNKELNDRAAEKEKKSSLLSEPYRKAVLENLEKICLKHPNYTSEQLLLASTGLALENGFFVVYNLKDYLEKFEYLYHPKNMEVVQ